MPVKKTASKKTVSYDNAPQLPTAIVAGLPLVTTPSQQLIDHLLSCTLRGRPLKQRPICVASVDKDAVLRCVREPQTLGLYRGADAILPLGQPIGFVSAMMNQEPLAAVFSTAGLFHKFTISMKTKGMSSFFLGGTPELSSDAMANVRRRHPTLKTLGHRHGFFAALIDELEAVKSINDLKPDILWLDLPAEDAQAFAMRNAERLRNVGMIVSLPGLTAHLVTEPGHVHEEQPLSWMSKAMSQVGETIQTPVSWVLALPLMMRLYVSRLEGKRQLQSG